jgi:hypothetical protein
MQAEPPVAVCEKCFLLGRSPVLHEQSAGAYNVCQFQIVAPDQKHIRMCSGDKPSLISQLQSLRRIRGRKRQHGLKWSACAYTRA